MTRRRPTCTGVAASWCDIHGNCTCPESVPPEPGSNADRFGDELRDLNHPDCPLHSPTSTHAEAGR